MFRLINKQSSDFTTLLHIAYETTYFQFIQPVTAWGLLNDEPKHVAELSFEWKIVVFGRYVLLPLYTEPHKLKLKKQQCDVLRKERRIRYLVLSFTD
jgi:hypothetical protein